MEADTQTVWLIAARFVRLLIEQGQEDLVPILLAAGKATRDDGSWIYEREWEQLKARWEESKR